MGDERPEERRHAAYSAEEPHHLVDLPLESFEPSVDSVETRVSSYDFCLDCRFHCAASHLSVLGLRLPDREPVTVIASVVLNAKVT